jgi:hypothetical protein
MFPFLDFGAVAFVLFAGFGFGLLLGWALKDKGSRTSFDDDGGELVPLEPSVADVDPRNRFEDGRLADVIPLPRRRKAG